MKKIVSTLLIAVLLVGVFTSCHADGLSSCINISSIYDSKINEKYVNPQNLVDFASKYINTPYKSGGRKPGGFDCCGFVYYCYNNFGIFFGSDKQQRNGNQNHQVKYGNHVDFSTSGSVDQFTKNLKVGDLLFFKYSDGSKQYDHVAIYIGNNKVIHAQSQGVKKNSLNADWTGGRKLYKSVKEVRRFEQLTKKSVADVIPEVVATYATYSKIKVTKKTTVKTLPCSKGTNSKSLDVYAGKGYYPVVCLVKNSVGNYWYMIFADSDYKKIAFVYAGDAEPRNWNESKIKDYSEGEGKLFYSDGHNLETGYMCVFGK